MKTHYKHTEEANLQNQLREKYEMLKNSDRWKWQEVTGRKPGSETVDSVEKLCGYCETAVSASSIYTEHHTHTSCYTQLVYIRWTGHTHTRTIAQLPDQSMRPLEHIHSHQH